MGSSTSIALDSAELPCVAYYEGGSADLKFGQQVNDAWSIATIDTTGDTGQYCALAIDSNGDPHIAYFYKNTPDGTPADVLKYAWRSGGTWNVEVVDGVDVSGFCDLALDSSGDPHITYFNGRALSLKHAVKNSGSWSLETVDSGGVGSHAKMLIDSSDDVHVVYRDIQNWGVKYAVKSGGSWTIQSINGLTASPPSAFFASSIDLALTSTGVAHVVFRDGSTAKSHHAHNASGSWVTDIARSLGQDLQGDYHALQMRPGDVPTMIYFSYDALLGNGVRLAYFNGTWWVPEIVRPEGASLSLVLDSAGDAHMSYHAASTEEVQYAFQSDALSDAGPGMRRTQLSLAVSPNPVLTSTTLILRSSVRMALGLEIVDARGRLIRSLGQHAHEPGLSYVTWDGRDENGNAVGAGVYFAVSRPGHLFTPRKVVVVH